jgi:hypothetical protein
MVATSSMDATVRLWNFQNGTCVRLFAQTDAIFDKVILKEDILVACSKEEKSTR